jgi:DNA-directed RNA polymerase subunit RPC12/RpoP
MTEDRLAKLREMEPEMRQVYVCCDCGVCFDALVAEGTHKLECPHCDGILWVDE